VQRVLTLAILLVALLVAAGAGVGIALAADDGFDIASLLQPSASAGMLPPITIEGRKGWACAAERNATAKTLSDADLPAAR
jgi:hypothetical protein